MPWDSTESRVGCSCDVDEAATSMHRLCPMAALERISVSVEEGRKADGFLGLPLLPQPNLCKYWEQHLLEKDKLLGSLHSVSAPGTSVHLGLQSALGVS